KLTPDAFHAAGVTKSKLTRVVSRNELMLSDRTTTCSVRCTAHTRSPGSGPDAARFFRRAATCVRASQRSPSSTSDLVSVPGHGTSGAGFANDNAAYRSLLNRFRPARF